MRRAGVLMLVVLLAPLGWSMEAAAQERRFALIVANNEGTDRDTPLQHAEEDARRMERTLLRYGDFKDEDVVVLRGRTATDLTRALAEVNRRMADAQRSGATALLVLYYSGHADTQGLHMAGTVLPHDRLRAELERAPAEVRVAILDACRSGVATRVKGGRRARSFEVAVAKPSQEEGTIIITSSASGENSHESDALGGSIFSHHLLNGLEGAADASGDARVTLAEAYAYAYERTVVDTLSAPTVQHPTYSQAIKGRRDVWVTDLSRTRRAGRLVIPPEGSVYVFKEEDGPLLYELGAAKAPRYLMVGAGRYWVRIRRHDHILEGEVRVTAGGESAIAPERLRRVDYAELVRKGSVEGRPALAVHASAGARAVGELVEGWGASVGPVVQLGVDLSAFSLGVEGFYAQTSGATDAVAFERDELALSLSLGSGVDVAGVYLGLGLRGGATRYGFRYDSAGVAPDAVSWRPSAGAEAVVEWNPAGAALVQLGGGAVVTFLELEGRENTTRAATRVAPFGELRLGWYLW